MIPKKIHYCWFGGAEKGKLAKKCIKSWKKKCPGYEIIEWNESNYDISKVPFMKEAYDAKKWGFVPDYARLDIIYNHGGIYLDTDVETVKSFDSLLDFTGFAGYETVEYVALGLGFGAEKNSPIIKEMMKTYEERHFLLDNGEYDMTPSPSLDTSSLKSQGFAIDGKYSVNDGFVLLPTDYLCPINFFTDNVLRKTDNTISIHHYAASWFSKEDLKKKERRWKHNRRAARKYAIIDAIKYFPHRVFIRIFGKDQFNKFRNRMK